MSSRFSNLEFEGHEEQAKKSSDHYLDKEKNDRFYMCQAEQLFRDGRFEKALRSYSKVLELNSSIFEAWFGQVRMLIELDELDEADIWVNKALERYKDNNELIAAKAVANVRMGNMQQAMAYSDASLRGQGSSPYLWLVRGEVLLAGKQKNADYCFSKATIENKKREDWFLHLCIGRIYKYYKKFTQALQEFQKALELETGSAFLWYERGTCQMAIGMNELAIASFNHALEIDPLYEEAKNGISDSEGMGFFDKLKSVFNKLFR